MTRLLYRSLLQMHPTAFRRRFAAEMLCIFDEVAAGATMALFADAVASLARQWFLRAQVRGKASRLCWELSSRSQ